jgi:cyanophycinase
MFLSALRLLEHRLVRNLTLVFLLAIQASAASGEETAGFPWLEPAGVSKPVLLCASDSLPLVRPEFEKLTKDDSGGIVVVSGDRLFRGLPHLIVQTGDWNDARRRELIAASVSQPDRLAVHLGPRAALALHGRRLQSLGGDSVTILLAASPGRPVQEIELKPGEKHDFTMLRRAALERAQGNFPPAVFPSPSVPTGTLLIHGGGEMPPDVTQKFIELAGGPDAPIVVPPIAAEGTLPDDESRDTRVWTRAGATNVRSLRARDRAEVESPEFAAAIEATKAVWFSGGRQWRFVDAYMGTKAEALFRGVLARGGVIGGSSAGASIQGQYMPRGSALGNTEMMAEGYERGLGFLPGVAVDQHFTQRKRLGDMTALMRRYPQFLGIGLDEGTAIVVQGSTAQVIGRGGAHFYDYCTGQPAGQRDYQLLRAGGQYDLARRRSK